MQTSRLSDSIGYTVNKYEHVEGGAVPPVDMQTWLKTVHSATSLEGGNKNINYPHEVCYFW